MILFILISYNIIFKSSFIFMVSEQSTVHWRIRILPKKIFYATKTQQITLKMKIFYVSGTQKMDLNGKWGNIEIQNLMQPKIY